MKIMIVDNHPLYAEGLKNLLFSNDFETVALINNYNKAVELALEEKPDVIFIDIKIPGLGSVELIGQIKEKLPKTKIIILTSFEEENSLIKAVKAGVSSYLLKSFDGEELIKCLREIEEGLY